MKNQGGEDTNGASMSKIADSLAKAALTGLKEDAHNHVSWATINVLESTGEWTYPF